MSTRPRAPPTYAGPRTWALAREAYLSGEDAKTVCERFGLKVETLRAQATRNGWTKRAYADSLIDPALNRMPRASGGQAVGRGADARSISSELLENPSPDDALSIAEAALARALEALAAGRPGDAAALIKDGDAVGAFADFVQNVRRRAELRSDDG